MARRYELKARAELRDATRQRIVDAAIELHRTIGPGKTTVSEIADRADVGRVTVYRHFPDELALARACSGHYFAQHPFPDLSGWKQIEEGDERLRTGLREAYAWFGANMDMIGRVLADVRDHPVMAPYHAYWEAAAETIASAYKLRGRRRAFTRAAAALALDFDTHRTLTVRQGLGDEQALELMAIFVGSVASGSA